MLSAQSSGFGGELLSLMQLLFFLALGYVVTKLATYFSRPPTKAEAFAKKIDDEIKPKEDIPEDACDGFEEMTNTPSTKLKARHTNVQERKKQKKTKASKEQRCEGRDNNEVDIVPLNTTAPLQAEASKPCDGLDINAMDSAPEQAEADAAQEEEKTSERVAKLMAKKSERKARKALEKRALEEKTLEGELRHQSEEPSVASVGEQEEEEEKAVTETLEDKSEVEAAAGDAQTTSTESMVDIVSEPLDEMVLVQLESTHCDDERDVDMNSEDPVKDHAEVDDVLTDDELICVGGGSVEGISTPEMCFSPRQMDSPPNWCGMPQPEFSSGCDSIGFPQLVLPDIPQIEGWMPILVPAEHAPPGAFDGIWKNSLDERIVIHHSEIIFESGMRWAMRIHSHTHFSVEVEDEEFEAELVTEARCLKWSDGDNWTCIGQTENQQQWSSIASPDPEAPCLLWEQAQVAGEPFFPIEVPPQPLNTQIPKEAETWEICWDWKKKGWCPRGHACDWYHPSPADQGQNFCAPCVGTENFDGPFADEQGL